MNDSIIARRLLGVYVTLLITVLYIPMVVVGLASISRSRFFVFPIRRTSTKREDASRRFTSPYHGFPRRFHFRRREAANAEPAG